MVTDLTPETCRAGRALLDLSQAALAERAGVARLTVADFERGARRPTAPTLAAIRTALEAAGVDFLPGGAALRGRSAGGSDRRLADILRALYAGSPRLKRLGVRHLSLFGSTARGSARPDSDVDLLVELDPRRKLDLLDYAGIVGEIQKLLPQRVDVARRDRLKPHVTPAALRDEIHVF
ncbi:MAG TPA: nucleotidyltransferase domain-containing protein [Stellaceae bacterium]|nr:nucleotidyltransferase domain-containing protein [Stellaceae bacterium]